MLNDVPSTYFSHLDQAGHRRDKDQRPELSRCSVEFVAPGDYMVRPPQPPVYFFVIDVSESAVASGMIRSTVNAIRSALDQLPGQPRTQIGFITFDAHIHFYNLKSTLSAPQMLVISDITDPIMPLPEDLLVNLQDSRKVVDALLDALPTMFHKALQPAADAAQPIASMAPSNSCLGPALMAAKRVIQHVGGKLCVFQASLPTLGEGALKMRENPRLLGTDKEHTMLVAEDPWYKTQAIDFSRLQVSVDTFLFSGQYTDLATISALAKYTAGSCYYYPAFFAPRDGAKYEKELYHDLTRATAFEAVMRVRATRGLRFSNFYGNYFIRGTDLLALPNCTSDSTFALDLAYDEPHLTASVVTIQAALLYTNSTGERRIRVHTMVLPVTNSLPEMIETADIDCAMNLLSKQAVDIAQKSGLDNARQRVNTLTVEMLRGARAAVSTGGGVGGGGGVGPGGHYPGGPGGYGAASAMSAGPATYANGSTMPNSLLLLPLYAMSLQKSLVLRGGTDVRVDERAFFQQLLNNMDIEESKVFIYPRMFSIHDMGHEAGLPCDNVHGEHGDEMIATAGPFHVRLPAILNLSYERLQTAGIVLLENGHDMFMWIGRNVNPAIISTLFGVQSLDSIPDVSKLAILPDNSDFSSRVHAIVLALRAERARYMQLHFIREGDGYAEAYFARFLIEDRANFSGGGLSYVEYHSHVTRSMG
jgi:protein transport protein SEC24